MSTIVAMSALLMAVPAGVRCLYGLLMCYRNNLPYSIARYY